MKGIILFFCFLYTGYTFAQTLYTNDFDKGFGDILLVDNDKKTPGDNVVKYKDAWNLKSINGDQWAISNSWYSPSGKADDWMILPKIEVSSSTHLSWNAKSFDRTLLEAYEVRVSTTGSSLAAFDEVLFKVEKEDFSGINHLISLEKYRGKSIHIAYRNISNDKYFLMIDDVRIFNAIDNDLGLQSASTTKYIPVGKQLPLTLGLINNGLKIISSFKVKWKLEQDSGFLEYKELKLSYNDVYDVVLDSIALVKRDVLSFLNISIEEVNGEKDKGLDDNFKTVNFHGVSAVIPKKNVVEYGTGTWCVNCPLSMFQAKALANKYRDQIAFVAVHIDDPMRLEEYENWFVNQPGYIGIPTATLNREELIDFKQIEDKIKNNYIKQFSPIEVSTTTRMDSTRLYVDGIVTIRTQMFDETFNLIPIVLEDEVKGNSAAYNQANAYANMALGLLPPFDTLPNPIPFDKIAYNNVSRRLINGINGRTLANSKNFSSGEQLTFNTSYLINPLFKKEKTRMFFVITDKNGHVLQSSKDVFLQTSAGNVEEDLKVKIFPNPTNDFLMVSGEFTEDVEYIIYTIHGQLIRKSDRVNVFNNQLMKIDLSSLEGGSYFIKIKSRGLEVVKIFSITN